MPVQGFSRVILVGHSYGTYLVNRLASHRPDAFSAVVLIGAGYPTPDAARLRWIFNLPTFVSAQSHVRKTALTHSQADVQAFLV
jgi:pimeloyl-ACP methyl ester carboxylesterase